MSSRHSAAGQAIAPGTSRRGFFKASGSAATALAAAPLAGIAAGGERVRAGVFQHDVASGDPVSDRIILRTRVTPVTPGERQRRAGAGKLAVVGPGDRRYRSTLVAADGQRLTPRVAVRRGELPAKG